MSRRQLRQRWSEAGTSLVEIVFVMALMTVIIPVAFNLLGSVQRTEVATTNSFSASAQIQQMNDVLSKQLRAAATPGGVNAQGQPLWSSPIVSGSANAVTFFSNLGNVNGPTEIAVATQACATCSIPTTSLVETVYQPTAAGVYPSTGTMATLGTGLVVPTANPTTDCGATTGIFQYLDPNNNCLSMATGTSPVSLSSAQQAQVAAVALNLSARAPQRSGVNLGDPITNLTTTIYLENVQYANP